MVEIELSKIKLVLLALACIAFVVFGGLFAYSPEVFVSSLFRNPLVLRIVGIVAVLVFGVALVSISKKIFSSKIGLRIDNDGIFDNATQASIGMIKWDDITSIETIRVNGNNVLLLKVNTPDKYIDKAKNRIARSTMKNCLKMYGTPIALTATALKIKFSALEELVQKEFAKRKS